MVNADPQTGEVKDEVVALATTDDDEDSSEGRSLVRSEHTAMAVLTRSEVEMQIDAAHRYPRSVKKALKKAEEMATLNPQVAASCIYALPRKENGKRKIITGPSVRLAEIMAVAWGNLHAGARVLDVEERDRDITAQGLVWDLERNLKVTIETRRRITTREGKPFSEDMVIVTGNAAASIAYRNAVFRVVPRAYVDQVMALARKVAVGDAKSLDDRRAAVIANFGKLGVTVEQILARVGKEGVEDIGVEELGDLIAIGTSIRDHGASIDEFFGPQGASPVPASGPAAALQERIRNRASQGKAPLPGPKARASAPTGAARREPEPADPPPPDDVVTVGDEREREPGQQG